MGGHDHPGGNSGGDAPEQAQPALRGAGERRLVFLAVCALGISSLMTQLALMRELLCVFSGNELVFGIVLGNWLLLTGIGSYLGKGAARLKRPATVLVFAQLLVATLPIADVFLVRTLRNVVFIAGAQVGVIGTVLSSFVLLLPYCLIAGYLLTLACCVLARTQGPASIGQVYFMDNLGDIAGGVLFSLAIVYLSNHFHILYFPAALNLLSAVVVALVLKRKLALALTAGVTAATVAVVLLVDLDEVSIARQYAGERIVFHGQSPYGNLVVTESAGQLSFIESGVRLFSTQNREQVEETVHYPMAQRPEAKRVLLISGGVAGTAKEILEYGVQRVDYVELDPLIVQAGRKYAAQNLADPRIHVIGGDGRLFVRQTQSRYDVVIADLPDPSTSQLNRFYTREFFEEVGRILTPEGVLALSVGHYENYVSEELAAVLSVAERTLKSVFSRTRIIPGGRVFFLASNGPLYDEMVSRIEAKGIDTQLISRSYLDSILAPDRVGEIRRSLAADAPLNEDFNPVLYYRQLVYWTSQFRLRLGIIAVVLGALLAVYLLRGGAVAFAIFTTGCAASALEVVVLLGFQVVHGYVYQKVGLIVTMFIVGLAIGSYVMNRMLPRRRRRDLVALEAGIAAFAVLLPLVLMGMGRMAGQGGALALVSADVVFPLLALVPGVLVGMEFPLAGKADFRGVGETASRLYAADFVGAALGAMVVGAALIPVLGVTNVCLLTAGLNLASGCSVWLTGKA